eukprot:PhM_4_TR3072/c2_g2_i8/m.102556
MGHLDNISSLSTDYFYSNKYFCQFVSYTFVVTSVAAVFFTALQANTDHTISLFDAWFLAISCFSCTGLATVEYYEFRVTTLVVMLLTIELGNMVMCSAGPSMLRLLTLHRKLDEVRNAEDSAEVRTYERKIVLQVIVNRTIVWFCTVYVLAAHTVLFLLVLAAGQTGWWALFHTVTGLNNAGFALQKENFAISSIASDQFLLFAFILAMPMGNTLYPCYLRLMLAGVQKILKRMEPSATPRWYLLGLSMMDLSIGVTELFAHPRRYYTHLFGVRQTVYLFIMWCIMTIIDFGMFLPEFGSDSKVFLSHKNEVPDALFQTVPSRTGFTIVNLHHVRQGHISWWIMAMYLSSYPFIISERSTREAPIEHEDGFSSVPKAFEGLHRSSNADSDSDSHQDEPASTAEASPLIALQHPQSSLSFAHSFVRDRQNTHEVFAAFNFNNNEEANNNNNNIFGTADDVLSNMRSIKKEATNAIAREMIWLYLAIVFISYFEGHELIGQDITGQSAWCRLVFEVASAYGTVGLSLSSPKYPTVAFTACFNDASMF